MYCEKLSGALAIVILTIFHPAESRSPRILTGTQWVAVTETALNVNLSVKASGSHPQEYLLPPPSDTRYAESNLKPLDFVPFSYPSIQNHRLDTANGTNSDNKVIPFYKGPPTTTVSSSTKERRRVNVEKFRECVFFQLCDKSECFHYGRFGQCKTKGKEALDKVKTLLNKG